MTATDPRSGGRLSERELEVLALVAEGLSNSGIAARLCLSGHTVKSHLRRITIKLGSSDRHHSARMAGFEPAVQVVVMERSRTAAELAREAAAEAAFVALELLVDGRPWAAVRREALVALTAAGRRGPGGCLLVPAQDRRVAP